MWWCRLLVMVQAVGGSLVVLTATIVARLGTHWTHGNVFMFGMPHTPSIAEVMHRTHPPCDTPHYVVILIPMVSCSPSRHLMKRW